MKRVVSCLCLALWAAASVATVPPSGNALIKAFLSHSDVKYGGDDDAKSLEGRLYVWAEAGESLTELKTRAVKAFGLSRVLADRLVPLILQRGALDDQELGHSELVSRFIALSHAYPQSHSALLEAGRTIITPFDECDIDAYERLLRGRPHADADRVALFKVVDCPQLLTERTSNQPQTTEPYLTLAEAGDSVENSLLGLAIQRLADEKAEGDPAVSREDRLAIRVRHIVEELGEGRLETAVSLLPASPKGMARDFHDLLGPEARRDIVAAYVVLGQMTQAQAWWADLPLAKPVDPASSTSAGGVKISSTDDSAQSKSQYEQRLLARFFHPSTTDGFDLLADRYRLGSAIPSGSWGMLWSRLYNRLSIELGYAGFAEAPRLSVPADKLASIRIDALNKCYRCAPDLLAMVKSVAAEYAQRPAGARPADDSQLPAPMLNAMDAIIAAPRTGWSEHPLPLPMRRPHPKSKPRMPALTDLLTAPDEPRSAAPAWANRLPRGELVRYQRQGQRVVAVTVSQTLDPTGEISAGGYWISFSDDGGKHFRAPLYSGLRMFEPYVVLAKSKLPMLAGDHLQLEVAVHQIDDEHVMLPPVHVPMKTKRDDLYIDIPLADLARDTDGDGLTDIAEWAMLLDPNKVDTDGDGIPDGIDSLPQIAASHGSNLHASALVAVLNQLFDQTLGAIVTTSAISEAPGVAHAITNNTDSYNDARAIFIEAPAAYFSGITLRGRMIVLNRQQVAALKKTRGLSFVTSLPVFEVSHDGRKALVVWSSGWSGGTYLLTKEGAGWKFKPLQRWIT